MDNGTLSRSIVLQQIVGHRGSDHPKIPPSLSGHSKRNTPHVVFELFCVLVILKNHTNYSPIRVLTSLSVVEVVVFYCLKEILVLDVIRFY